MPETAHKSRMEIRKAILDMLQADKEAEENEMDMFKSQKAIKFKLSSLETSRIQKQLIQLMEIQTPMN